MYFLLLTVETVFLLCAGHISDVHPHHLVICKSKFLSYEEFVFCCAAGFYSTTCFLLTSTVSEIYKS